MKEDSHKLFKKLTLFFSSNPVPFNEESYQKQKEPDTSFKWVNNLIYNAIYTALKGQLGSTIQTQNSKMISIFESIE